MMARLVDPLSLWQMAGVRVSCRFSGLVAPQRSCGKHLDFGKRQPLSVLCFLAAAAPMKKKTIANTKNIDRDVPCVGSTAIAKKTAAATRYPHLAMNLFIVITPSYSQ